EKDIIKYENRVLADLIPKNGGAGNDLAISEKTSADYTTFVSGILVAEGGRDVLYVKPFPINERLDLARTIDTARVVLRGLPVGSKLYSEAVAYQRATIKEMSKLGLPVVGMTPIADKRARLETAAIYIKNGQVKFPQIGCEDLLMQLLGFGVESH